MGKAKTLKSRALNVPWHAPNQLRRTTDINTSARLDVLCATCQSFCRDLDANCSMKIRNRKEFILPFEHHQSSVKLKVSSGQGCHLCILLLKSLELADVEVLQGKESKPLSVMQLAEYKFQLQYLGHEFREGCRVR